MSNPRNANLGIQLDASKALGIEFFAVGVGTSTDQPELALIASDPDPAHLFNVAGFSSLETILTSLIASVQLPEATNVVYTLGVNPDFTVSAESVTGGSLARSANQLTWT